MNRLLMISLAASAVALGGCTTAGYGDGYGAYDYNRPDPAYGAYYPERYYRESREERRLTRADRIYRGRDGRYYCRKPDGTTGLIVGALAGGVLGNIIAPGGSDTIGTLIGAGAGALLGREIERNEVRCR